MLTQGAVVHAGYRVLERIAQGEIGELYKAERLAPEQLCVLKVLNPGLMSDSMLVERFKQEAKRACTFWHPNAVRIEGFGEAEDGRPFVVMEYLPGENLREVMAREGRLSVSRACFIAREVAAVLQAAHAQAIVHQDITPSHIMLVETPAGAQVRLLDCCIARIKEDRRRDMGRIALRRPGILMGTPYYLSPEMAVGKPGSELDGRSDLYSLGVVLYQMLCGELPFEIKSDTMDALLAHLLIPPKPISRLCPDLPDALVSLVTRMLEKKPESRPASARMVAEELERVELLLRQASAMAPAVPSPPEAGETVGDVALSGASTRPSVTVPLRHSGPPAAGAVSAIQLDTGKPKGPAPPAQFAIARQRPAAIDKAPRRWLRWAAGMAIMAFSLGLVTRFFTPRRSKITPYSAPPESSVPASRPPLGRSSPDRTSGTGQTGRSKTIPTSQPGAPLPTSSRRTNPVVSGASSQPAGAKPGARASQDRDTARKQAAQSGKLVSEANRAGPRPSADLAKGRALKAEGDGFFRRGEYDRAIQSYERALRLDPASEALHTRILRARTAKAAEEQYLNE